MLNERKQEIIKLIHNQQLDIEEIAEHIGVSSRTIRRDLINITDTLDELGYTIQKSKSVYKVIDENNNLFEKLNLRNTSVLNSEEKVAIAFSVLGNNEKKINIESVANDLFVTPSSIKSLVCQFLEEYNVQYKARGIQIAIDINDVECRELIVAILRNYIRTTDVNSIILEASINTPKIRNNYILKSYINVDLFDKLFIEIENIFNERNKYVTDFQLIMIAVTICVSERQATICPLQYYDNTVITNSIIEEIIKTSGILNKAENNYLSNKLDSIITELEYERVNLALISDINEAILEVEQKIGIEFSDRRKLEYQICTHNARTSNKISDVHLNRNMSLKQFVSDNMYIFEVIKTVDKLNPYNEQNLQYILIYFVMALEETISSKEWKIFVICFGGVGTSLMIKKQLEKEYPNSFIQNLSYARALAGATNDADLIVSNYKLPNNLQNLVVGHVISKEDLKQINSILLKQSSDIKSVQKENNIIFNIGFQSNDKTCDQTTENILDYYQQTGVIADSKYIFQKLKKREMVGVGIPESNIAFFHTRSSSVKVLTVATYDVEQFETNGFDGKLMKCNKILLVLVPVEISDRMLERVNILSYSLISDEQLLTAIVKDDSQKIKSILI